MHSRRKSLAASALGRKKALARWAKDRVRRDAEEPARIHAMELARIIGEGPIEKGQYVGTLQWADHTGKVRRWTIRRGSRSGAVMVDGIDDPKTVTWLLDRLRRHLSSYFRTGQN
jgi:multidrug efflux pump subunit AcrA (membrane-fusion protein)